jgi:hypothetical protein
MQTITEPGARALFSRHVGGRPPVPAACLRAKVECPLCGEPIEFVTAFQAIEIECPACCLAFPFDPCKEPLAVPGVRLASLRAKRESQPKRSAGVVLGAWLLTLMFAGAASAGVWATMMR